MSRRNGNLLTQNQVNILFKNGVLDMNQIEKCVELKLLNKRHVTQKKRMMKTSDGRYTEPILSFVGNGRKTPYTDLMKQFKEDFDTLVEMYTEEMEVNKVKTKNRKSKIIEIV